MLTKNEQTISSAEVVLYYSASDLFLIGVLSSSNHLFKAVREEGRGWEGGGEKEGCRGKKAEGEGDFCVKSCWEQRCQLATSYAGSS